jgi:hypothetical protein
VRPQVALELSVDDLLAKLRESVSDKSLSYNETVRAVSKSVTGRDLSGNWRDNQVELRKQGCEVLFETKEGELRKARFVVLQGALRAPGGLSNDVYVDIGVGSDEKARIADAGLITRFDRLYVEAATQTPLPEKSAVRHIMDRSEISESAKTYPYMRYVAVSYGNVSNYDDELRRYGFRIHVELAEKKQNASAGKQIWFYIESELDCPELKRGEPSIRNYVPRDVLGWTRFGGSVG